ncbi:DUF1294 domain-containing protein [Neobacillus notoginsengisoli]|uniref:DUF1294 domain-containing protein n=2 Tax=Neobacillus notoginsengisoli TaxID=1578198 RepID=A0A417YUQ8_9BACI|nr:DUF1294 domain-containing protein [Neobacillus notoginsengisoli]RHW40842.1 DUF1294 domain-containing protein [Neobacillus notoginsengisoli]
MNIIAFTMMGIDKERAKKHAYRIRESSLWLSALLGGALGAVAGMKFFRHKTKHAAFKVGMPLLAFIEIGLLMYWMSGFFQ